MGTKAKPLVTHLAGGFAVFELGLDELSMRELGPRPTLGELQRSTPWVWLWRERCQRRAPLACAVAVYDRRNQSVPHYPRRLARRELFNHW
jgi:hypothetical protein